jgi:hypothetical protein
MVNLGASGLETNGGLRIGESSFPSEQKTSLMVTVSLRRRVPHVKLRKVYSFQIVLLVILDHAFMEVFHSDQIISLQVFGPIFRAVSSIFLP